MHHDKEIALRLVIDGLGQHLTLHGIALELSTEAFRDFFRRMILQSNRCGTRMILEFGKSIPCIAVSNGSQPEKFP